ncbi:MAG: polysaccharide deacetylase family protein [Thermogutta sp.]
MPNFRLAALTLYYFATWGMRKFLIQRWRQHSGVPMTVLMYHHISSHSRISWITSLAGFSRHVNWLSHHAEVISLQEIQRRLAFGNAAIRPCVAITFDDGYAANLSTAVPLLLSAGMPVTFFVTVSNVLSGQPVYYDQEQGQNFRPISSRELRDLAESGVEIGSHGLTHADFSRLTESDLVREMAESKMILEDLLGKSIRALSVPFGRPHQMTRRVFEIAQKVGYACVCSAYGGYNIPGYHGYHIRRFHGDDPLISLINRATIDPRLVWHTLWRDPVAWARAEDVANSHRLEFNLPKNRDHFSPIAPVSAPTNVPATIPPPVVVGYSLEDISPAPADGYAGGSNP